MTTLFHVTMIHSADNCPAYEREKMVEFIAMADQLDARAKELGVTVHNLLWGAPEHVAYALLEADSLAAVSRFVFLFPMRQEFRVTPVQHLQDVVATGKAIVAQPQP